MGLKILRCEYNSAWLSVSSGHIMICVWYSVLSIAVSEISLFTCRVECWNDPWCLDLGIWPGLSAWSSGCLFCSWWMSFGWFHLRSPRYSISPHGIPFPLSTSYRIPYLYAAYHLFLHIHIIAVCNGGQTVCQALLQYIPFHLNVHHLSQWFPVLEELVAAMSEEWGECPVAMHWCSVVWMIST